MRSAIETSKRRCLLAVVAGAALLATALLLPAPGDAHRGGPPKSDCEPAPNVNQVGWGDSCFEVRGDDMWVRDQVVNNWGARVQVQAVDLRIGYRKTRWCANSHGADSWHECKFDHREDACVRWRMFEQDHAGNTREWTQWSAWHDITTGAAGVECNWLSPNCGEHPVTGDGRPCPRPSPRPGPSPRPPGD